MKQQISIFSRLVIYLLPISLLLSSCDDFQFLTSKRPSTGHVGGGGEGGGGGTPPHPPVVKPSSMVYLSSSKLRVGFNMLYGGTITHLSGDGPNLINNYDLGRQLQYAYYAFPVEGYLPNGKVPHPAWTTIGWDPIQSGDVYGNGSEVVEQRQNGNELYFKTIPKQWGYDNVPCECYVETYAKLTENVLELRHVLQNNRTDSFTPLGRGQELEVGYFTPKFNRFQSYWGDQPFSSAGLTDFDLINPPVGTPDGYGSKVLETYTPESWVFLHEANGQGIGLFVPGSHLFASRFAGRTTIGGEFDYNSAITGGNTTEVLDRKIRYESKAVLILGNVNEVRKYAYDHKNELIQPDFDFSTDRQHWTFYEPVDDGGVPFKGEWSINLDKHITNLWGPLVSWKAAEVPKLYLRIAYKGSGTKMNIFWEVARSNGLEHDSFFQNVNLINDGQYHTYEVDLSSNPGWRGLIRRISLTPTVEYKTEAGQFMKIKYISKTRKE